MSPLVPAATASAILCALVALSPAQQQDPPAPGIESARPYLEQTSAHLTSTNPRVRYAAREALANFGRQAVPMIKALRAKVEDPNVRAFLDRTLVRVQQAGWRASMKNDREARRRYLASVRNRRPYDIDRVAMQINLTFAQVGKLDPMLGRHFKQLAALWGEMREAGALKDRAAYRDYNEEVRLLVKDAEPKLGAFLDAKQVEYVKRLMLRLRGGGAVLAKLSPEQQRRQKELTERWNNRENLSEEELEALKREWGEFKREAYGGGK
jgi:hypothetical protein